MQRWTSAELRFLSSSGSPSTVMRIRFSANAFCGVSSRVSGVIVDAVVVVELGDLVVNDLHDDVRRLALDEARVDDVVGVHVAAALELDLLRLEEQVRRDGFHRAARARRRQADVVAVDERRAALEPLVARVADEAQPRVGPVGDVRRAPRRSSPARPAGTTGAPFSIAISRQRAPRRVVDARDHLGARRRAQLRLVGQLLQRVVVPELHLDAAVERPALRRRVRAERPRRCRGRRCRRRTSRASSSCCTASATRRACARDRPA